MKNIFIVILILMLPLFVAAQAPKYVLLDPKDDLIGEWEWVKDPTGSPFSPVPETDFIYIHFSPGDSLSIGSIAKDDLKGKTGNCYFIAKSNGSTVFGVLSNCSNFANNGKAFRFDYKVMGDELVITVKGEEIIYRRK
ncbi:MAG: hypothetical protein M3R17_19865 [Bacteroidota bacterium]|nr:hypothetical protein [Bacteroidota bacterium]